MNDYFLKAENEEALQAALEAAQLTDQAVDIIGEIPDVVGYHANLRGVLTDEQKAALPIIPTPANPVRVWF